MKMKFISFLLIAFFTISFVGCVGDDIDDLQGQIDDLNDKVDDLEAAQEAALLAAIADIQAAITALENDVDADYQDLLANLTDLEDVVANNKDAIYYGNLITDEDFDAFLAQGAEIVTGRVEISNADHISEVAKLMVVGGDLIVTGGVNIDLPNLTTVAGGVLISGIDADEAVISLPKLASTGNTFEVSDNAGVVSLSAGALVLVSGDMSMEGNDVLTSISFESLAAVGNLMIENNYTNLSTFNINNTKVIGDIYLQGITGDFTLSLGEFGGDLTLIAINNVPVITYEGTTLPGNLYMEEVNGLTSIDFPNLTTTDGSISLRNISLDLSIEDVTEAVLGWTNNLTELGASVEILNCSFAELDVFNNVVSFKDQSNDDITIMSNGSLEYVFAFNKLDKHYGEIRIDEMSDEFNVFSSLTWAQYIDWAAKRVFEYDMQTYEPIYNDYTQVNGFDNLVQAQQIKIDISEATSFTCFSKLENVWAKGTTTDYGPGTYGIGFMMRMQSPEFVADDTPLMWCEGMIPMDNMMMGNIKYYFYKQAGWNPPTEVSLMDAYTEMMQPCFGGGVGM